MKIKKLYFDYHISSYANVGSVMSPLRFDMLHSMSFDTKGRYTYKY